MTGVSGAHERELELLAGHVLSALGPEDEAETERLLTQHVPTCEMCRSALADLQAIAGELALAAPPVDPPEILLARIRRELRGDGRRRRRGLGLVAMAAGLVALVGMTGVSVSLGSRATRAEAERITAMEMLSAMRDPTATPVHLQAMSATASGGLVEVAREEHLYLYGEDVPTPPPGFAYQLWLGSGGVFVPVGDPFVPRDGVVLLRITVDPARFDELLITEELVGEEPERPRLQGRTWHAELAA